MLSQFDSTRRKKYLISFLKIIKQIESLITMNLNELTTKKMSQFYSVLCQPFNSFQCVGIILMYMLADDGTLFVLNLACNSFRNPTAA